MENRAEKPQKTLMLLLTDRCNLHCRYCYENNRVGRVMKAEDACLILEEALSATDSGEYIWRIEFFGGETLLAFQTIKAVFDYVKQNFPDIEKYFTITTNGTMFNEKNKAWFREHAMDFRCTLSLDGTPAMHDLNRRTLDDGPTWELIDLDFVKEVWPNAIAKMTLTEKTLPHLADGIRYIESLGLNCKVSLASGIQWNLEALSVLYRQLERLIEHYSKQSDSPLCSFLDLPLGNLYDAEAAEDIRFCDAGLSKRCFDMTGHDYPCQGLTPLAAGSETIQMSQWDGLLLGGDEGRCKACRWKSICPTCYAANRLETGRIYHCGRMTCLMHQLCILAASYIQFYRMEPSIDEGRLSDDDRKRLYGISLIQRVIPEVHEIATLLE